MASSGRSLPCTPETHHQGRAGKHPRLRVWYLWLWPAMPVCCPTWATGKRPARSGGGNGAHRLARFDGAPHSAMLFTCDQVGARPFRWLWPTWHGGDIPKPTSCQIWVQRFDGAPHSAMLFTCDQVGARPFRWLWPTWHGGDIPKPTSCQIWVQHLVSKAAIRTRGNPSA